MSRTTKHTPAWVRINRNPHQLSVEIHDHRFGPCDLPELPVTPAPLRWHKTTTCYFGCPCWMCHYPTSRYLSRAQARALTYRLTNDGGYDEAALPSTIPDDEL
jgi:hypothetical protein